MREEVTFENTSVSEGLDLVFEEIAACEYPAIYVCVDPDTTKMQLRSFNSPNRMQLYLMISLLCDMYQKLPPDLSSITVEGNA
jgi:hypothetical protein